MCVSNSEFTFRAASVFPDVPNPTPLAVLTWWVFPSLERQVKSVSNFENNSRNKNRPSIFGHSFFACRGHRTTPHSLSYVLAKFHVDPCSLEASARSQRGGMRCCVRRVPISENFPIRFPISEIRNRELYGHFDFS